MSFDQTIAAPAHDSSARVVGDPEVMRSAAGFYVGCSVTEDGFTSPHSRYSDYFPTAPEAQTWLDNARRTNSL